VSVSKRWRFGVGQTTREEQREIAEAMGAGRGEEYARGQQHARMVEAERERRRARHPNRKRRQRR
jgi:hypothetical protein